MKTILRVSLLCMLSAASAATVTAERMAPIPLDKMTPAQRKVAEDIMSGPRGGLRGPFNSWLRSPELADRLQKVGEYLRFNTSLDKRVNEMAIIMTAQAWGSQYEWYAHAPLALKAGLDPSIVEAVEKFGEQGVMDLIAVNGYYDVVSMTLNVARVAPPAGEPIPFKQAGL
jgi:4-carboxymuconolactone decarboxylase